MINEVFKSIHESIKRRNTEDSYIPLSDVPSKDVIHRGYIRKTGIPIRYDMIPDGKHGNSGKHVYHFKDGNNAGFMEIDHKITPKTSGHETISTVKFEMEGVPEIPIELYRGVIVPAFIHHYESHEPDIIDFDSSVIHSNDLIRRLGSKFDMSEKENGSRRAIKKLDPKISRILVHIKKTLNKR